MTQPTAQIAPPPDPLFAEMLNDIDAAIGVGAAAEVLRQSYGLGGEVTALPGERDSNFLVVADGDQRFVLKASGPSEPPVVTDLQLAALRWLATSPCDLSLPRLQATLAGDDRVAFADASGRPRIARLLSYVPGQPLRAGSYSRRERVAAGEACGKLTLALDGFDHPAARREIVWDVVGGARLAPLTPCLPTEASRTAAERLIARFTADTLERVRALPHQVVHNDLNAGNLMTSRDDPRLVTGVIDFGDVLWTATIADLAVAITSLLTPDCALREALADGLSGYRRHRQPGAEELAVFPRLVAMRLLLLMLIPVWHRTANSHNSHYAAFNPEFEVRSAWIRRLIEMDGAELV